VRVFYKPTASIDDFDTYTFMIPSVANQRKSDGAILLDDFNTFLLSKIGAWNTQLGFERNIVEHCEETYNTALTDDLSEGVDDFLYDLYETCDVPQPFVN